MIHISVGQMTHPNAYCCTAKVVSTIKWNTRSEASSLLLIFQNKFTVYNFIRTIFNFWLFWSQTKSSFHHIQFFFKKKTFLSSRSKKLVLCFNSIKETWDIELNLMPFFFPLSKQYTNNLKFLLQLNEIAKIDKNPITGPSMI